MWQPLCKAPTSLALLGLCCAMVADSLPFSDAGPHVNYGWGEPIRLRHLYTASKHGLFSYFLRISNDGKVDGTTSQSPQSEYKGREPHLSPARGRRPGEAEGGGPAAI